MTCLARRLLSLSLLVSSVSGKSYRWVCDISVYPVTELVQDPSSGAIHVYKGGRVLEGQSTLHSNDVDEVLPEDRRDLERHSSLRSKVDDSWSSAVHVQRLEDVFVNVSKMIHFTGRECWCANNDLITYGDSVYYCTTPYTHCGIPWSVSNIDTITPGCINQTKTELFAKGAWPVIIVWFAVLFTCVCCTKAGHQVYDYVIGMLFPGWNVWVRDRILRHDRDRANRLIRQYWRRRHIALEARYLQIIAELREVYQREAANRQEMEDIVQVIAPPNELALKTRIFNKSTEAIAVKADLGDDDSEFDDETTCTICFGLLDDGDRVGALACDHIFHVECLKRWLVRRNTCPLCQMQNAATPRYTPRVQETDVPLTDVAPNGEESEGILSEPERANEPLPPITQETPAVPVWQNALRASINRRQRGPDID